MSSERRSFEAIVEGPAEGPWEVRSPGVGLWSGAPQTGALVGPGSEIGELRTLNRRRVLLLPRSLGGRVESAPEALEVAVGFGETLFRVAPIADAVGGAASGEGGAASGSSDLPEGCVGVVAPTDGVFYRRPEPGSPPFVEPGGRISAGQPVGLVEVMKTFNQILYGGAGLPDEAEVVEFRRDDGDEIRRGDLLLVVR